MTIASESADLNQQYAEKERTSDIVYEMVFHNNGNPCGGWIDTEEVRSSYDATRMTPLESHDDFFRSAPQTRRMTR